MTEPNPARPDDGILPAVGARVKQSGVDGGGRIGTVVRSNADAFTVQWDICGYACSYDRDYLKGDAQHLITLVVTPSTSRDGAEGTGEAAARYEFPYQRTFEAIAAATSLYPSKDAALGISVSVQKFQDAFNNYRDARPLAPPKPAPDALRALEPFAKVAEAFDSWPGIKRQPDGANICTFFTASGRLADAATINYGHCRKARAALDALSPAPVPSPDALREINAASPNPCKQPWNCVWPACGVGPLGNCGKQSPPSPMPPPDGAREAAQLLRTWAKAYRDRPEHRFPSDPNAEFFPVDLEQAADLLASPSPTAAEPVAWRWRPWGSANWIYDPTPEWREANKTEAEFQPLYASLPAPSLPDREELAQAAAQRFFRSKLENLEGASMDARWDFADDVRGMMRGASTGEQGYHKLDNERQVFFYEQDFYVLSNFSSFRLEWKGRHFDTSEAAYHWEKFVGNDPLRILIKCANSAHEAFKIAETNRDTRRPDWDAVKVNIMRDILQAKADQHEYVRRKLLATDNRELIEDSWRDDFWGWGPNRDGQNMLGKLWMEIRDELRARQPPHSGSKREGRG